MNLKWTQYLVWLVLLLPLVTLAQVPQRPVPPRLVNDLAGILTAAQVEELENLLVQFDRETSTQVAVVIVPSLEGMDPGDFAFRIGESWGVGHEGKNNGVVMLVKPKTEREQGKVFIAVGYGLEGVIPDAVANGKIIDQEMIPRFRENDYFGGIKNGLTVIMELARGEYTAEQYSGDGTGGLVGGGFIFLVILMIIIFSMMKGGNKKSFNTGTRNLPLWILLGMMNSGKRGGSWSDFSGGRGGFGGGFGGGGGGGGFGGFGGGSFGGGGAGGSW